MSCNLLQGHSVVVGSWLSIWAVSCRYSVLLDEARPGGSVSSWLHSLQHARPHWLVSRTTNTTGKVGHTLLTRKRIHSIFRPHRCDCWRDYRYLLYIVFSETVLFPLGLLASFLCYLQYYPSPLSHQCDSPLVSPYYSTARLAPNRTRKYTLSADEECV